MIFCATQKRRCSVIICTLGFPWLYQKLYPLADVSNFWIAPKVISKQCNDCNHFAGVSTGKRCTAGGICSGVKKLTIRKVCFWCPLKAVTRIVSNPLLHFDYVSANHDKTWKRYTQNRKTVWGKKQICFQNLKAFLTKKKISPILPLPRLSLYHSCFFKWCPSCACTDNSIVLSYSQSHFNSFTFDCVICLEIMGKQIAPTNSMSASCPNGVSSWTWLYSGPSGSNFEIASAIFSFHVFNQRWNDVL